MGFEIKETSMQSLERVALADLTPKEFAGRYRTGQGCPVVISGALDGLPAATLDWIVSKLPASQKLPARFYGKDHFKKPKTEWKKYSEMLEVTPSEYAALLTSGTAHTDNIYMAQVAIGDTELASLLRPRMTALGDRTGLQAAIDLNLWWGPGGHTEPLHYDSGDGTLLQLHGQKRAILFPPAQTRNLYPFPIRRKGIAPWISRVYIDKPDFDAYPRMREALEHKIEVMLGPGELLFIPANWWHEVSALSSDYICSVNRFWKVAPLTRLFTNNISPWVYGISMVALALMRKKDARAAAKEGAA
jgi:lysine-specific demethylase 8/hypoxia-inducible factor 1-alpha inhibitor (HIF hydroxylase)